MVYIPGYTSQVCTMVGIPGYTFQVCTMVGIPGNTSQVCTMVGIPRVCTSQVCTLGGGCPVAQSVASLPFPFHCWSVVLALV